MKKTVKKQKRPNAIMYFILAGLVTLFIKIKYGFKTNKLKFGNQGGLVICSHLSFMDCFYLSSAVFPTRINFLCAYYYFMINKALSFFLSFMGVIPKYQFGSDRVAIKKMIQVVNSGGYIGMMPEGTVSMTGENSFIAPQIVKLIRLMKCSVYGVAVNGAYLSAPKWSIFSKSGKVVATKMKIVDKDELKTLTDEEIYNAIVKTLYVDEIDFAKENKLFYKGKNFAEGLERILYVCPKCHKEHSLSTKGEEIFCDSCDFKAKLLHNYQFEYQNEKYFDSQKQWLEYQRQLCKKETSKEDFSYSSKVKYLTQLEGDNKYTEVGSGVLTLKAEGFTYCGTFKGEDVEIFVNIKSVPSLVVDQGKNFELPYTDHIRCFEPENRATIQKWTDLTKILVEGVERKN